MSARKKLVCAATVAALAFAGCGGDDEGDETGGSTQAPADTGASEAPKASVTFVTPKGGSTVGDEFTADIKLEDFELDPDAVGKSPVSGKGHLHFQLDGGRFDIPENS